MARPIPLHLAPRDSRDELNSRLQQAPLEHAEAVLAAYEVLQGLDRHRLLEVLSHTAVIAPAHLGKLSRADRGDYSAQFAIRLMNKDFGLVLETAAAAKVPMPATAAAFQMNVAEFGEGKEEDFSAVITLMERLAQVKT